MNASYAFRLVALSLASFFLVNAAAAALIAILSRFAIRLAHDMPARSAARFLFALRIAPGALAILVVAAFCVPSYLWLEPESASEQVSGFCALAAVTITALWMRSIARSARAIFESRRYVKSIRATGQPCRLAGESAILIPTHRTTALVGLFHPEIVISHDVLSALSEEQLSVAIFHERSH